MENKILVLLSIVLFPVSIQAEVIFGYMPSCYEIKHQETNQIVAEWFEAEIARLEKDNPRYKQGTIFQTPLVESSWIRCDRRAKQYVQIIEQAVTNNRENFDNPNYTPQNISELIVHVKKDLKLR